MVKEGTSRPRKVARHRRVRRKVVGTAKRPRLAVFRSLRHIYAQVIDDSRGVTLAASSSLEQEVVKQRDGLPKSGVSSLVGSLIASRALAQGINTVVYDRGGHKYHGRAKALADAARKGGLVF